nr:hypothetical protein [Tanacetum cinerariifolium]
MYHKKNVDFGYLMWEDFLYQVEHKDAKKSNEMYYLRFTKVIINFFITKDPSIPRRNKVNWHYVKDDQMFTTIKLVLRHQNTQQFGTMLPFELTNEDIRNSAAYKEYYAIASGAAPPKTKATKGKQPAKSSKAKGLSVLSEVALTEAEQIKLATKRSLQQTYMSQASKSGMVGCGRVGAVNFAGAVSSIPRIVERYTDQRVNEVVKIIKEQVKEQVKVQVSKILPKIEKTVNEQLEVKVLTRSSNSSKTSYDVAADLSEMELKKILIENMESNKSIRRSDKQRNLYKALFDAYECDKIILDTYGDTVTLKRRRDDVDKDKQPFAGSNRGSKRRREGKEPESTSAPKEKASKTTGKSTEGSKSHQKTFEKQTKPPTPDRAWNKTLSATYESIQPWISDLAKQADSLTSFNELMDTPMDFSTFLMNRLKVNTLTPELLAGPTYELIKGSCKSIVELEFFLEEVYKATTDKLD